MTTSLQWPPLYNGHLSTMATSAQWPPLYNSRLSTTLPFYNDHLFWRTVHTFTLVSTSLQWPPLYNGHLSTMANSLRRPPLHYSRLFKTATSPLWPPLYNGHLATTTTSLQRPPLHSGHLSSTVTSPQRPPFTTALFLVHSPYIHYIVSTSLQRLQRPLSSVPNVAVVERFNCNLTSSIANEDV